MEEDTSTEKPVFATNSTAEPDYFENVYSYKSLTPIKICFFITGSILGILGPSIIIWYERNCGNRFRTIINQMIATGGWYLLAYTMLMYIPDGVRFVYGPFGEVYCDIHVFVKNMLWSCLLLTLDVILILRYVFIFTLKNFAVINDDILAKILNQTILLVSIWASVVKRFTLGKLPMYYYLCAGTDPNEGLGVGHYLTIPRKYNTGRIIVILSFLLHLLLIPRILYYQLITDRNEQPLELGTVNNESTNHISDVQIPSVNRKKAIISGNQNKIVFGIVPQIFVFLSFVGIGILIRIADSVEPTNFNLEEYHWISDSLIIYAPSTGCIALLAVIFTGNSIREFIWRKIKFTFGRNQVGVEPYNISV